MVLPVRIEYLITCLDLHMVVIHAVMMMGQYGPLRFSFSVGAEIGVIFQFFFSVQCAKFLVFM